MADKLYFEFCKIVDKYAHRKIECDGFSDFDDFYFTIDKTEFNKDEKLIRLEHTVNGKKDKIIEMIIQISGDSKSVNLQCFSSFIKHSCMAINFSKIISDKLNKIVKSCGLDHTKYDKIDDTYFCHQYSVGFYKSKMGDMDGLSYEVLMNMLIGSSLMTFSDKTMF